MTTILYDSFGGRFSDNPRAIYEELVRRGADVDHVWRVAGNAPVPAGVRTVSVGDLDAVRSADFLIGNAPTLDFIHKRPGARYLQTWHGTPLKRLFYDNPTIEPESIEARAPEIAAWDFLLSPNHFSTPVLAGAFGVRGRVLETGYPRNDILSRPEAPAVRSRVREQLGIEDGTTVVLYAPTWRDDLKDENGLQTFRLELDVEELVRKLGEDHAFLLRLHGNIPPERGDIGHPAVQNVSAHPDISDLYLAADVMITDYSSSMFDFAVTGKPLLYFTYDIAHYRDVLRGFYFDFAAEAPGPLLATSGEVIEALMGLEEIKASYAAAYAAFREKFCHLDDGHASERVIHAVFGHI